MIGMDFATVESLAKKLCEESGGPGHWEKYKTKRQHWRDKAMAVLAEQPAGRSTWWARFQRWWQV